ncbi:MAG: IclR family transcriptional regulator C-terminal domain-containing protein [Xanthobacter sp.]
MEQALEHNAERLNPYHIPIETLVWRINTARKLGYVHVPRAITPGTSSLSVPIYDPAGRPIAAVNTIVVPSRQSGSRLLELVGHLNVAAEEIAAALISDALPYRPPVRGA